MAEKRMFTKIITESDLFLDMPLSAQCLYFHLNMEADDDGFIDSVKRIKRMIGASDDDLKLLIAKQFLIPFESGVIVIKHWRLHNTLRKDRYKETIHKEEKEQLQENEDTSYSMVADWLPNGCQTVATRLPSGFQEVAKRLPNGCQTVATRLPSGCQTVATRLPSGCQTVAVDKNRIDKNRIDKSREEKKKKETANASSPLSLFVNDVIDYLNMKCNTHYKATTPKTRKLVETRKKEGFTLEDFKTVIDNKFNEWHGNEKMEMYLRPETLFGTKFEPYLNQKPKNYENNYNYNNFNNEKEYVNSNVSNASDIDLDGMLSQLDFEGCKEIEEREKILNE